MANYNMNCEACNDLRETDPYLMVNGIGESECTSLKNDTGLVPTDGRDDCQDLNDMNDCFVGNMAREIDAESECNWKSFVKRLIGNVWTLEKAIICAICGIWTNIHALWDEIAKIWAEIQRIWNKVNCIYTGVVNLINALNRTTQGQSFVRYYRDNSGTGQGYQWNITDGADHTLDIYMDCDVDNPGSQVADRDYVVMITNCTDISNSNRVGIDLTYYSSGDGRGIGTIRKRQAQHPHVDMDGATIDAFSWPCSGSVFIRAGEHVRVNAHVYAGSTGQFRLHQFVLTWIPVNLGSSPLDPSSILPC